MYYINIKQEAKQALKKNRIMFLFALIAVASMLIGLYFFLIVGFSYVQSLFANQSLFGDSFLFRIIKYIYSPSILKDIYLFVLLFFLLLISGFIAPALYAVLYLLGKSLLEKNVFDFERVFTAFKNIKHIMKFYAVMLLYSIIIGFGFLIFFLPGIILSYTYSQAIFIMADNPEISIIDALKKSRTLMSNNKMDLFIFQFSFFFHFILGIVTLGIYYFYFIPYYNLSMYNYYYHLTRQHILKPPTNGQLIEA